MGDHDNTRRYAFSLLGVTVVFAIVNAVRYWWRTPACCDWPYTTGIPFAFLQEGGFGGIRRLLWGGLLGQPVQLIGQTPGTEQSNAFNFDFFAAGYTGGGAFNLCGRYLPSGVFGGVTGIGPSLHIVSQPGFCNPLADPTNTAMGPGGFTFTAHIDSAFGFNPIGFIWHEIVDVLLKRNHGC